jgi:Protein of unknown function (DUF732)
LTSYLKCAGVRDRRRLYFTGVPEIARTRISKPSAVLSLSAAGLISMAGLLGLLGPPPVARADTTDDKFLSILRSDDINHESVPAAIEAGHKVCEYFVAGMNWNDVASDVQSSSGLPDYDTGYFMGAAIAAYCPAYMPDVPKVDLPPTSGRR